MSGSQYNKQSPASTFDGLTDIPNYNGQERVVLAMDPVTDQPFWEERTASVGLLVDGGGFPIDIGVRGDIQVPFKCRIIGYTLLADQPGIISVDIWNDAVSNFPPTVAQSITALLQPSLDGSVAYITSTILTDWSININAGDILRFNVDSNDVVRRLTAILKVIKT